jgi:hypothetical protein
MIDHVHDKYAVDVKLSSVHSIVDGGIHSFNRYFILINVNCYYECLRHEFELHGSILLQKEGYLEN